MNACAAQPDGFHSPYIAHTGTADGLGSDIDGSRDGELDVEQDMGMRWTYFPVYWAKIEPSGPTDPSVDPDGTWAQVDGAFRDLRRRGMLPFVQVVIGGNAEGPPDWAGRRRDGSSAPADMEALIDFVGKLVERYRPCGVLAQQEGWAHEGYGVRAWELENEPDSYKTHWGETADDFAEYATLASARIRTADPLAVVVGPAAADGGACDGRFVEEILDPAIGSASDYFRERGVKYSAGGAFDAVSFHIYELLSQAVPIFACGDDTVEKQVERYRTVFERHSMHPGFEYTPPTRFWHTEGGLDFGTFDAIGVGYKANWMLQFFGRAFTNGAEKVTVMDAHTDPVQARAVAVMTELVPDASTMRNVTAEVGAGGGVTVYQVSGADGTTTYLAHAANGSTGAVVRLPVAGRHVSIIRRDGAMEVATAEGGAVTVALPGGAPYAEPLFVVDPGVTRGGANRRGQPR